MSESYPYLALSRRLGVDYGAVLDFVAYLEGTSDSFDWNRLTFEQREAVVDERKMELVRRENRK